MNESHLRYFSPHRAFAGAALFASQKGASFSFSNEVAPSFDQLITRHAFETFERVGIPADEEHQRGSLRIRFGAALFPFLECSLIDVKLARKDGA